MTKQLKYASARARGFGARARARGFGARAGDGKGRSQPCFIIFRPFQTGWPSFSKLGPLFCTHPDGIFILYDFLHCHEKTFQLDVVALTSFSDESYLAIPKQQKKPPARRKEKGIANLASAAANKAFPEAAKQQNSFANISGGK